MRKLFIAAIGAISTLMTAAVAMAAEAAPAAAQASLDASGLGLAAFAIVIGMGIAAAGCGVGQGMGLKADCEGVARNPEASNKLTNSLLLGLAFIESLAIYTFVICLILLFLRPLG
jgi:F-type H+-transporting ATPase subunit c